MKSVLSKPKKQDEPVFIWCAYTSNPRYIEDTLRFMKRWLDERRLKSKVLNIGIVEIHTDVKVIQFTTTDKIAGKMVECPGFLQIRRAS